MSKEQTCSLISVDLSGCRGLSSTAVRYLTVLCGKTLQTIDISYSNASVIVCSFALVTARPASGL